MGDSLIKDIKGDSEVKRLKAKHVREKKQLESKQDSEMKEMYSRQEAEMKEIELRLLLSKYRELEKKVHVKQESVIIDTSDEELGDEDDESVNAEETDCGGSKNEAGRSRKCASVSIEENSSKRRSGSSTPTNESNSKKARTSINTEKNIDSTVKPEYTRLRRSRRLSRLDPLIFPVELLKDDEIGNDNGELIRFEEYQTLSKSAKLCNKRVRLPRNIFDIEDYSHFVQKWFYGNRDPFVIPLRDLKKRVDDWKSIADSVTYYKFEKLGLLIEKVFPDIQKNRTLVNSIDYYMKNIVCEDAYLTNEIKTPETLSYFLNGGEKIPEQYKKLLMKGRHQMIVDILIKQR
ncbi:hypothetical protein CANINC_004313 [Pichia inconspicua]|uniref:Uncharacterized protein n=1 Tax=Pichia inconspicua TaxID=52247 RepID=A0A4T0WWG9_9ASCO|nr:hypothetical protein CANINC_004313 [[Candida] inconspicua]